MKTISEFCYMIMKPPPLLFQVLDQQEVTPEVRANAQKWRAKQVRLSWNFLFVCLFVCLWEGS